METITRTDRLIFIPLSSANVAEAHKVYSDGRIWDHRPNGRFADIRTTQKLVDTAQQSWGEHSFGPWAAYLRERPSEFIGVGGGLYVDSAQVWDLKYRLRPAHWGAGFATEITAAALKAIRDFDADTPITVRVTTNHPAAIKVVEKFDFSPVWEGRRIGTTDNPDEPDVRIYADRPLSSDSLHALQQRP